MRGLYKPKVRYPVVSKHLKEPICAKELTGFYKSLILLKMLTKNFALLGSSRTLE